MSHSTVDQVVPVVVVDVLEHPDLCDGLPGHRAGDQPADGITPARGRDEIVIEAADVDRLGIEFGAGIDGDDRLPVVVSGRRMATGGLQEEHRPGPEVEGHRRPPVVAQQVEGRGDLGEEGELAAPQGELHTGPEHQRVVRVDQRLAGGAVSPSRGDVPADLQEEVGLQVHLIQGTPERPEAEHGYEVGILVRHEAVPAVPLGVQVEPEGAGHALPGCLGLSHLGRSRDLGLPEALAGGLLVPTLLGQVAQLHGHHMGRRSRFPCPVEGLLRPGQVPGRLAVPAELEPLVDRARPLHRLLGPGGGGPQARLGIDPGEGDLHRNATDRGGATAVPSLGHGDHHLRRHRRPRRAGGSRAALHLPRQGILVQARPRPGSRRPRRLAPGRRCRPFRRAPAGRGSGRRGGLLGARGARAGAARRRVAAGARRRVMRRPGRRRCVGGRGDVRSRSVGGGLGAVTPAGVAVAVHGIGLAGLRVVVPPAAAAQQAQGPAQRQDDP